MRTKEALLLELKAKHFEKTVFLPYEPCEKCAIEKAYEEKTGNLCAEYVVGLRDIVDEKDFIHERYSSNAFEEDKSKAYECNLDDTVIRTIKLHEE